VGFGGLPWSSNADQDVASPADAHFGEAAVDGFVQGLLYVDKLILDAVFI
jgi:hypothetical protein